MQSSPFKFNSGVNSVLPFWNLLPSSFCSVYQRSFYQQCLLKALPPKAHLLLDALHLLLLFNGTRTCLEPELFLLFIFYIGTLLTVKILIVFKTTVCLYTYVYFFSLRNGYCDYTNWIFITV